LIAALLVATAGAAFASEPASADGELPSEPTPPGEDDGFEPAPPDGEDVSEAAAPPTPLPASFEALVALNVRRRPDAASPRKGQLLQGAVVRADRWAVGPACLQGWLGLGERGWICASFVVPTDREPRTEHALVAFDPPRPSERSAYLTTAEYPRRQGPDADRVLPYVYARRQVGAPGWIHEDLESARRGAPTTEQLQAGRAHHFRAVVEADEGSILVLPDGRFVRLDEVSLYAPSRFQGVAIDGELPAWVRPGGGRVRQRPSLISPVLAEPTAREIVWTNGEEVGPPERRWLRAVRPVEGWIAAWRVHRVRLLPPLDDAGPWIDLDLDQQVLTLRDQEGATYATLVSTGLGTPNRTPLGLYRIGDKLLHWDMASRADAEDPYHVEEVPFVMHFWPRYALHVAFWHDGFGTPRSHGCVNLTPHDARVIAAATRPALPPGWHTVFESPDEPGTSLRIHRGRPDVPDRRKPLR